MIDRIKQAFFRLADATTITGKVMGLILGLAIFLGLGFTTYLRVGTRLLLVDQLQSRGLTIAEGVATRAIEPVLMGNEFALHGLLEETVGVNKDVRYVLVVSARGEVLGDTFRRQIPVGLVGANSVGAGGEPSVVPIRTDEGMVRDIAFPLFGGRGGSVRVGMSERSLEVALNKQTLQLLLATLLTLLLGIWATYRLSHMLARPIRVLVEGTRQVAGGDLTVHVPVFAGDDLGHLAGAFNTMTARLANQYEEIRRFSDQVLRDNHELVALHRMTSGLNRLKHIATVPRVAARLIEHELGVPEAAVLLWNQDEERWEPALAEELAATAQASLEGRRVVVTADRAVVPLQVGSRRIGLLLVRDDPDRLATERCRSFLGSVGNHLTVALDNARLLSELTDQQQVLTHLFDRAVSAQEEERRRISRELHDETSQSLTSLMLGLRSVETASTPAELQQRSALLRERLVAALDSVHQMARRLRPLALDDLGLPAALTRFVQETSAQTGQDIDLDVDGLGSARLPSDVETAVYRILQEAVANAIRHGRPSQVSVVVEKQDGWVIAMVEDDGAGFDPQSITRTTRLGIYGMRERAHLVGGSLTLESAPGRGTTIYLRIPCGVRKRTDADGHPNPPGR